MSSNPPLRHVLTGLFAAVLAGPACIKRTAAPPPAAPGATASSEPAAAPSPTKPSAALEAANARIAGFPRADLLGGAGWKAFQVQGETAKVEMSTVPVDGQPFKEAARL